MQLYQNRLFEYIIHTFNISREDAEELVSDVLFSVVQRISLFEFRNTDGDFARWVFTIMRNRMRDFMRQQNQLAAVREIHPEDFSGDDEGNKTAREIADIVVRDFLKGDEDARDTKSRPMQLVTETLQAMETWERVLLRCRALDIPYEEIAPYVEKPAKQLKIYHLRAKRKFLRMLRQEFEKNSISLENNKS